jgi:magnesium-transporting ATPase (P-type)
VVKYNQVINQKYMINKLKAIFNRDRLSTPVGQGVVAGIMQVAYIVLVAVFMIATESLFSTPKALIMIFGIVAFLCLLVLSVAVTGVIVFIWPAYYFSERKYKESLYSFMATVGTIFVIFAVIFIFSALTSLI